MKYLYKYIFVIMLALMISFSCGSDQVSQHASDSHATKQDDHGHDHGEVDAHGEEDHVEGEIHLSKEQIKTVGISFGDFSAIKVNDFIRATGTLGLPPQSRASLSAKSTGFIKSTTKYVEGSYVKKGAYMAELENPDFIQKQQTYLETAAQLVYLNQELSRQRMLVNANAGVLKNLQKLEADVNSKTATLKGIGKQLAYLNINVQQLTPENITERTPIIAPMSGYITSIDMHNGMYVTPEKQLMEIISEHHLHLELDIFEKDIGNIKEEQKISYTVPALGNQIYEGEVHIIGKEFDTENKTVRIHGHLENEKPQFIKDLFVDAKIWLNDQVVDALPEAAIVKDGSTYYMYVALIDQNNEEVVFTQIAVIPGLTDKGFTSVKLIDQIPDGLKIVTGGAYYIYAQGKVGELEHNH